MPVWNTCDARGRPKDGVEVTSVRLLRWRSWSPRVIRAEQTGHKSGYTAAHSRLSDRVLGWHAAKDA